MSRTFKRKSGPWVATITWPNSLPHQPPTTTYSFADHGQALRFIRMCERDGQTANIIRMCEAGE